MFQSLRVAAGGWLALYTTDNLEKKTTIYNDAFFKMARGCKWLRVAADGCRWLQVTAGASGCKWPLSHFQPPAATCTHLQIGSLGMWLQVAAFSKIKMMHGCSLSANLTI
jgi:hypothetical protein